MGPATVAPVTEKVWYGTTTAMASFGVPTAGKNPIIQSSVCSGPVGAWTWAVPVFTATCHETGKMPLAVAPGTVLLATFSISLPTAAAAAGVAAVSMGVGLYVATTAPWEFVIC